MDKTASSGAGPLLRGEETMMNGARRIRSRSRRRMRNRAAVPVLPDELLWEILVRMPAKELLRCRAACRSWRRVTSDPTFLLAHHRHQPSLPMVEFEADIDHHDTVDALDLRRFPAVRRPVLGFSDDRRSYPRDFTIHASCDGLLLLSFNKHRRLYLCNPATRQWLALRHLPGDSYVAALYPHHPSGEYRILYWKRTNTDDCAIYYVLTVGSSSQEGQQQRCIGLPVATPSMKNDTTCWHIRASMSRSVLRHDCLHWYNRGKIVVFDTVAESFRWMQPPTATSSAHVLEMDGAFGIGHVDLDTMTAEAWVLHDYEKEIWSSKFRIKLPDEEMSKDATCADSLYGGVVVSESGDMMLTGGKCPSVSMFHCDGKGKLVEKFVLEGVEPVILAKEGST